MQSVHALDPAAEAYLPLGHEAHCFPRGFSRYCRASHRVQEVDPTLGWYVPGWQELQVAAPLLDWYVPA